MNIPKELTEEEVVLIMTKVAREKCKDYIFGTHSPKDMEQQAIMYCINALNANKFVPRENGKSVAAQLLNFLRVHVRNKLSNFRRKDSCRYANPENKHNASKYAIQHPVKIFSQGLEHSEIFGFSTDVEDRLDKEAMIRDIREALSVSMLKDFLKWMNGVKLPKLRQEELFKKIYEVLVEKEYEK